MTKKIYFYFVFVVQLFVVSFLQSLDLKDLKGTYTILKPEYQHLSPVHGAVWWETGLARKYYEFGNYEERKEEKGQVSRTKIEGDATMRLIHRLFHIVGGSFGITDSPYNPEYYFTPAMIGKILGLIETVEVKDLKSLIKNVIGGDQHFNSLIDVEVQKKRSSDEKQVKKEQIVSYLNGEFASALVDSLQECGSDAKALYPPKMTQAILLAFLHRKANSKQDLQVYFEALQGQILNQENIKKERQAKRVEAQQKSASGEQKGEVVSGEVLPAFKSIFFRDEKIVWQNWCGDVYEQTKEVVEDILRKVKALDFEDKEINKKLLEPDFYEQMVFAELAQLYMGELPNIVEDRRISLTGALGHITFPDCMETTIRNVSNIVVYDPVKKVFVFNKEGLELKPSNACSNFYVQHSNPVGIADPKVHVDWTHVVENIPFAIYVTAISKDGNTVLHKGGLDFVYVHGLDREKVKNFSDQKEKIEVVGEEKKQIVAEQPKNFSALKIHGVVYRIVDPEKFFCYQLKASIRNLIIVLNHILGLGLFDGKDMTEEFMRKDFNKIYFPLLCAKVGLAPEGIDFEKIDESDYRNDLIIKMTLIGTENSFSIQILSTHGCVSNPPKQEQNEKMEKYLFEQCRSENIDLRILNLSALYPYDIFARDIVDDTFSTRKVYLVKHYLFLQNLFEERRRSDLIGIILHQKNDAFYQIVIRMMRSFPLDQDLRFQWYMFFNVRTADLSRVPVISKTLAEIIHKIDSQVSMSAGKIKALQEAFALGLYPADKVEKLVQEGIKYVRDDIKIAAMELLEALIEKDKDFKNFEEVRLVAQEGMKSSGHQMRMSAINLFIQLVKKDKHFRGALEAAQKGIQSAYRFERRAAVNLFKELFAKGESRAIQAILMKIKSDDQGVRKSIEELVAFLKERGEWVDEKEQEDAGDKMMGGAS